MVNALAEGPAVRVNLMLSQVILEAQANAYDSRNAQPLAVISVENAFHSLSKQSELFVEQYAPNVAIGLVYKSGFRYFRGAVFEDLNAEPDES